MKVEGRPNPDAIYESVQGFASSRVPGMPHFVTPGGVKFPGSHPAVVEHFSDGLFRLTPEDIIRAQQAQLLELLGGQKAGPAAPAEQEPPPAKRKAGRPAWDHPTFWAHYRAAYDKARVKQPQYIAAEFERLDGTVGIEPDSLGRLVRRWSPE